MRKQQALAPQYVMATIWGAVMARNAWGVEALGMTTLAVLKRPNEVSRKISLATLSLFHRFMTNCSLQKFLVSCLSLDCQKGLLTYLYPHAGVIIYLFIWNGYWGVEIVLFLPMAPLIPNPFLTQTSCRPPDHISVFETSGNHRKIPRENTLSSLCRLCHFRVTLSSIRTQFSPFQFWVFTQVPFQVLPFLWNV